MELLQKAWIFDLDGTLANTDHRKHWLMTEPKNWDKWYARAKYDSVHVDVAVFTEVCSMLSIVPLICTGRGEEYRSETEMWLEEHRISYAKMYMRAENDRRDDTVVKMEMLQQMRDDGFEPILAFEDRDRVVKMWRSNGIKCFQVEDGNF